MVRATLLLILLLGPGLVPGSVSLSLDDEKKEKKPAVVYITRTGKRYHLEDCRYLLSKIKTDVEEATEAGYTPCKVCKPPKKKAEGDSQKPFR
jgi:competence protein ComEC